MSINSGPHCPGSTPAATCNGRVTLNDLHSIRSGVPHLENEGDGTASTSNGFLRVHPSKSPMNARKGSLEGPQESSPADGGATGARSLGFPPLRLPCPLVPDTQRFKNGCFIHFGGHFICFKGKGEFSPRNFKLPEGRRPPVPSELKSGGK